MATKKTTVKTVKQIPAIPDAPIKENGYSFDHRVRRVFSIGKFEVLTLDVTITERQEARYRLLEVNIPLIPFAIYINIYGTVLGRQVLNHYIKLY